MVNNLFLRNPLPWTCDFDPDSQMWYIMDDFGNDFLYAPQKSTTKDVMNYLIKAVNAYSLQQDVP